MNPSVQTLLSTLTLPEQTQRTLPFAKANKGGIRLWLDDLPRANLGGMSKLLFHALQELNNTVVAEDERLDMLDMLWPEVQRTVEHLNKQFLRASVFLDTRRRGVLKLSQSMFSLLADGYFIVVRNALSHNGGTAVTARAIHSALSAYSQVLLLAGTTYSRPPTATWLKLHTLYQLAEISRLTDQCFAHPVEGQSLKPTIEMCYLRPVLLSTLNTNRLRSTEIRILDDAILTWSQYSAVSKQDADAIFALDLAQDSIPDYIDKFDSGIPTVRYISTRPISKALLESIAAIGKEGGRPPLTLPPALPASLLRHIATTWSQIIKRQHQRLPSEQDVLLGGLGMTCCHFWLSGGQNFTETLDAGGSADLSLSLQNDNSAPTQDAWQGALDVTPTGDGEDIRYDVPAEVADIPLAFQLVSLAILNSSPGGYCLRWPSTQSELLQVGELLCLKDPISERFSVGAIRWMDQTNDSINLGVEIVSSEPRPIAVKRIRRDGAPSAFLRGLLIPEVAQVGKPASMLIPRTPFSEGNKVQVREGRREGTFRLQGWISGSSSWCQYAYEALGQHTAPTVVNTGAAAPIKSATPAEQKPRDLRKNTRGNEFDDLWDKI